MVAAVCRLHALLLIFSCSHVFMKLDHIAIYVKDLDAVRDFFLKYFDGISGEPYQNPNTGFRSYFISFADGSRMEIMTRPGLAMQNDNIARLGYIHMAFSVGSRSRVDELTALLSADGFETLSGPRVTGDGYYESQVMGIEGNVIEITE